MSDFTTRFSPIDFPWLSTDPEAPCCMCPDVFREKCIPMDYCPQHGVDPDYSQCHDAAAARQWRIDQGTACPTCGSGSPAVFRMVGCGFKCDDIGRWHEKRAAR